MSNLKDKKLEISQIDTIERIYGRDFGVKNDKHLGDYLKKIGYASLSRLLKND